MQEKIPTIVYIDATNLYKGVESLGKKIDYKKFKIWLLHKYNASEVILFMGFLPEQKKMYNSFEKMGYSLIFKETVMQGGRAKGNADAEMVLQCARDTYEKKSYNAVLISGDGDFSCLVDFLEEKNKFTTIIIPNRKYCSYLLRKKNISLTYIQDFIHLFSKKTPG